ncbi:MAG: hypothetical protein AAFP16_20270 [Pseudomonadota bacterium]
MTTVLTARAATAYSSARLAHFAIHVMALPVARAKMFPIGVRCHAVMSLALPVPA